MSLSTVAAATITGTSKSLSDYIFHRLGERSGVVALIDDTVLSRVESIPGDLLLHRAVRVADCLVAAGIVAGDVVAMFCESRPEVVCVVLGALLVGVTVAFINCALEDREVQHALNAFRPKQVYTSDLTKDRGLRLAKQCVQIAKIVVFGNEFLGRSVFQSFNVIVRNAKILFRKADDRVRQEYQPNQQKTALVGFDCDGIGRFRSALATQATLLDILMDGKSLSSRCLSKMPAWTDLHDIIENLKAILNGNESSKL